MENQVYERDYGAGKKVDQKGKRAFAAALLQNDLLKQYASFVENMPKHIVKEDKANYEHLLKRCDALAKQSYGHILGIVDHEKYQSVIRLNLPFIEFSSDEELHILKEIAEKARCVSFTTQEENSVTMSIFIDYFAEDESFWQDVRQSEKWTKF